MLLSESDLERYRADLGGGCGFARRTMNDEESLRAAIHEHITIVPYDRSWPHRFAEEEARLVSLFGESLIAIEHIGSTAVPGLFAKPVIDIMAAVDSLDTADALIPRLCENGYTTSAEFNATLKDRRWLMRHSGGHRTHHLHLMVEGGAEWDRTIAFRNLLRENAAVRSDYAALKQSLAESVGSDRDAYTAAKTKFIESAIKNSRTAHP